VVDKSSVVSDSEHMREQYEAGMAAVGKRIKSARSDKGLSQAQLGAAISVSGAAVQKWESGGGWELVNVLQVATVLDVPPAWLLEPLIGSISPPPKSEILSRLDSLRSDLDRLYRDAEGLPEVSNGSSQNG
jgi:transcriptional regulator with XRE-family HTH domain